ncbi:MAG: DUF3868 domain-containing protein [Prevotella sp.]|nr:DUF3868 domain-containing protein [Prevotella sp.]
MKRNILLSISLFAVATVMAQVPIKLTDVKQKHQTQVTIENYQVMSTADKTVVNMDFILDSLKVKSARYRAFTPILRTKDGSKKHRFKSLLVTGRVQDVIFERDGIDPLYADNCVTVRRDKDGGRQRFSYMDAVAKAPWHQDAEVWLESDLCGCGDTLKSEQAYLGPLFHEPPVFEFNFVNVVPAPEKKIRNLHGTAYITFVVDRWEMKPDYMDNYRELRKITDTLDVMNADKNISIKQIKIHGWASPESPYEHNKMLATNRAKSLTDYVRNTYQLPAEVFAPAEATPENWIGLREAVDQMSTATLPHRAEILRIIDDLSLQPDPKEKKIKQKYPAEYQYLLKNVYPRLRRSDYEITFQYREFTLEEAKEIYKTKPYQLSLRELWDVANTFEPNSEDYNRVMQTAANIYPESPVAAINLANIALRQNDLLKAETLLEHAGDSAEAENARAILYMKQQRWAEAEVALSRAEAGGMDVSENRKTLQQMQEIK